MRLNLLAISRKLMLAVVPLPVLAFAQAPKVATPPTIGGCAIFPADNIWNTRIDGLPVDHNSDAYIQSEGGRGLPLHPDFGTVYEGAPNGLPFVVVPPDQPRVKINFIASASESDRGPYPVPPDAPVQGGLDTKGDRHVIVLQSGTCQLYELFSGYPLKNGSWQADSGAAFDLTKNAPLRPAGWTSADAAGLPILPGLVRYDEVQQALAAGGVLHHALRLTAPYTRAEYIWPARHLASSSNNPAFPPMGQRFRLKASVSTSIYPNTTTPVSPINQVILRTLQQYGAFLSDNGGGIWGISGAPDPRWSDDELHSLVLYKAADFEAVDEASLLVDRNSGAAAVSSAPAKSSSQF